MKNLLLSLLAVPVLALGTLIGCDKVEHMALPPVDTDAEVREHVESSVTCEVVGGEAVKEESAVVPAGGSTTFGAKPVKLRYIYDGDGNLVDCEVVDEE